jgi:hypothetical protein
MSEQIRRNYPEEYRKSHAAAEIPAVAYGEPEDLATLAVFLASPVSRTTSAARLSRSMAGCGATRSEPEDSHHLPLGPVIVLWARRAPLLRPKARAVAIPRGNRGGA